MNTAQDYFELHLKSVKCTKLLSASARFFARSLEQVFRFGASRERAMRLGVNYALAWVLLDFVYMC